MWIGKNKAQNNWSPHKVNRRIQNRSQFLTCKTLFECTDVLLFSIKHLAHNLTPAVKQSYNPGIMTQSFSWDSRAIKSANLWEKALKCIKCIQFLHLLWELKVETEKNTLVSFLKIMQKAYFCKTYAVILKCGVQNCSMIYCTQTWMTPDIWLFYYFHLS